MQDTLVKVFTHAPTKIQHYDRIIQFKRDPESGQGVADLDEETAAFFLKREKEYGREPFEKKEPKLKPGRILLPPEAGLVSDNLDQESVKKNPVPKLSQTDLIRKMEDAQKALVKAQMGIKDPKEEAKKPQALAPDSKLPAIETEESSGATAVKVALVTPEAVVVDISKLDAKQAEGIINDTGDTSVIMRMEALERARSTPRKNVLAMLTQRLGQVGGTSPE